MKLNTFRGIISLVIFTGSLTATPAFAQSGDSWEYSAAVNLWASGLESTTGDGTKIDVGISDILDNLDMTIMGTLEGRKDKWSWLTDVIFLSVSTDQGSNVSTPAGPVPANVDVGVDGWVWNFLAGYNLSDSESGTKDLVFGARYLDVETSVTLNIGGGGARVISSGSTLDGVVGIRGKANLQGNWYAQYYADIGVGESDFTWQAIGGFGRKYSWGDMTFAYRHLEWEFDANDPIRDISFSGPIVQAKWHF